MKHRKIVAKIINYIDIILKYAYGVDYNEFKKNTMMIDACVFNLSQTGELVNKLDKEYISANPEIPWFKTEVSETV